jgi:hypothetical protein
MVIPLWRFGVITGRVSDEQDEPLVGTDVRAFHGTFAAGRRQWTFMARAITDDRGIYRFSQLLPGAYLVVVPATVASEPDSFRGQTALPTTYYQTMSAFGAAPVVFDAARIPAAPGSLVTSILSLPGPPPADAPWLTYPSTYFPSTTAIAMAEVVEAASDRERANVNIAMRAVPTFTLSGTLTAPAGIAPEFHAIHLLPADSADRPLVDVATAVTDTRGAFTFFGVPAGQYIARTVRTPAPGSGFRMAFCGGTGAIRFLCTASLNPMGGPPPEPTEPLLYAETPVTVVDRGVRGVALEMRPGVRVGGRAEFEGDTCRASGRVAT